MDSRSCLLLSPPSGMQLYYWNGTPWRKGFDRVSYIPRFAGTSFDVITGLGLAVPWPRQGIPGPGHGTALRAAYDRMLKVMLIHSVESVVMALPWLRPLFLAAAPKGFSWPADNRLLAAYPLSSNVSHFAPGNSLITNTSSRTLTAIGRSVVNTIPLLAVRILGLPVCIRLLSSLSSHGRRFFFSHTCFPLPYVPSSIDITRQCLLLTYDYSTLFIAPSLGLVLKEVHCMDAFRRELQFYQQVSSPRIPIFLGSGLMNSGRHFLAFSYIGLSVHGPISQSKK